MIKIEYDRKKCNACNYCVEIAPDRWSINKIDSKAELYDALFAKNIYVVNTTDDEFDRNFLISKKCQGKAIKVFRK